MMFRFGLFDQNTMPDLTHVWGIAIRGMSYMRRTLRSAIELHFLCVRSLRERSTMNQVIVALFAIPILCIILIGLNQFRDEMFKKKFLIDRRNQLANYSVRRGKKGTPVLVNRRYNDAGELETHDQVTETLAAAESLKSIAIAAGYGPAR
jgi:hypothetical protein